MQLKLASLSCSAKFAKIRYNLLYGTHIRTYNIYVTYVCLLCMCVVNVCCLHACVCVRVKTLIRNSSLRYSYNLVHTYVQICLLCIEQTRTGVSLKYWSTVRIKPV